MAWQCTKTHMPFLLTHWGICYDGWNNFAGNFDLDTGGRSACMAAQSILGLWANRWYRFSVGGADNFIGIGGGIGLLEMM